MPMFRTVLVASCFIAISTVSQAQQAEPATGAFQKQTTFGVWSKNIFADAVTVTGPAKTIYLAGMGSEDATSGVILYQGNFLEQCRYAYAKIRKILATQGATTPEEDRVSTTA
jgi:enamine deaminase RidA (YjgF/YER057c/UK114 family)